MAKRSLGRIPVFGEWIRDIRSVFIDRDDARSSLKTMEEGIDLLKKGFSLVIYPEGTRSRGPELGEFKKGSLRLATKSGVPVVPVTLFMMVPTVEFWSLVIPKNANTGLAFIKLN